MPKKITLICSTYNQPRFLEFVLDSINYQSFTDFELIIADDGSKVETKDLILKYKNILKQDLIHLWHEDIGWRKSQIHNEAIRVSSGELLVFIDGDCILSPSFLEDHWSIYNKEHKDYVLMGRRIELGPRITNDLMFSNYRKFLNTTFSFKLLFSCLMNDSKGFMRKYSLTNKILRKFFNADNVLDLLGSNFSLPKECMIKINGFNEDYQRGEDGDIFVRLRNSKFKTIGMKYFAVMYHLWHTRDDYKYVDDNYDKILKIQDYTWAENGLKNT
jgi:glycosyltransferase involved in cell wall biosynthesis